MSEFDKEELERKMNEQNLERLRQEGGLSSLIIFTLENFAFRYLETDTHKDIKCNVVGDNVFVVKSFEEDILKALKTSNQSVKQGLISLCKKYPGAESKKLKVCQSITVTIKNDSHVQCLAEINWNYPEFSSDAEFSVSKKEDIRFDDPLYLRNKLALYLESVCEIF